MHRKLLVCLGLVLLTVSLATAAEGVKKKAPAKETKELSGMSIVGNDEAPKSLYIVPWKSSELKVETSLDMMSSEADAPVDRDVFKRMLEFYKVSTKR